MQNLFSKSYYEDFEIDLTGTCNLSCPLCTRNYEHAQHTVFKNIRPLSEIITSLDEFTSFKKCYLAGQVSEPTLYPEFLDFIRYLKKRNISIKLFSNGSTRDESFWSELATILTNDDEMHFTICGSTQELHSKYRVGSNLDKILKNVKAYKKFNCNDYCQFIRFKYNEHDEINVKKFDFSNHYTVDSEGDRLKNSKIKPESLEVRPLDSRDKLIKFVLSSKPKETKIDCKWLKNKKIYINQNGDIFPCYMHCEYDYDDKTFIEDNKFNYNKIESFSFTKCILCEKNVRNKINSLGLDFLC